MLGFLQCIVISSYGGNYTNTIKATALEMPSQPLTKESNSTLSGDVEQSSDTVEEHALTAESTSTQLKNDSNVEDKQTSTEKSHSVALSILDQDTETMKDFIEKDHMKEYAFSLHDHPDSQRSKQFYLDSIEILFRECSKAGGM